ncbi:MAG TPA: adenylate/guanylate cyclase domain-containing protein [Herbaspirillum sp.]|uniref:adenylate/guanylate cyclase domain-containing protein n=1 Tax=Herbaspirillum sp. TaxID=1890675 RepID=UPI002D69E41C|nr:adenylate/guanylate cyclase domain-containing protein [Herbaspirillum sp.]HZG18852.1 adenylate/guanylate cyclase domain-containing protein [Herbaspirillum sp.]
MAHSWDNEEAGEQIEKRLEDVKEVTIIDYKRDMSLEKIATNKAYRVDGVHLYADILNLDEMLNCTEVEGVECHRRTLRFLNQHYRAVNRILGRTEAKRIDFHNQRLHSLIAKPYNTEDDAEKKRVQKAVAIAQLIIDVLQQTGDDDEHIPAAKVRVGIDSGLALAVNNGRNGNREPLFLGEPANHAAKFAAGSKTGIYLTNKARLAIGLAELDKPRLTALTAAEIENCQTAADLDVTVDEIVDDWREDLENNPIGQFQFSGHTPPMKNLPILDLTPANSRRQDATSIYADIDGFTKYVADHIDDQAEDVVRCLHVIRAELERVVKEDFEGRRIRFVGDCIHAVLCEGTAQTTEVEKTITDTTLCAGALRSSFDLALEKLADDGVDTAGLGLAIGFEFGPIAISRLGIKGDRVRCAVSRGVLTSEVEQGRCTGTQTAIGPLAYDKASQAVKDLFNDNRKVSDLDYNEATEALSNSGDEDAKASRNSGFEKAAASPAIIKAADREVRPHASI